MIIYIAIIFITAISAIIESETILKKADSFFISRFQELLHIILLFILTVVSGTRLIGGSDYYVYENAYNSTPNLVELINNTKNISESLWISFMDYGYLVICSVFKSLNISFHFFCLFEALFFYCSLYHGLKNYCNNFSIVLLVFVAKLFFYDTFISMRQSITIAIFFLSLPLIENKRLCKYLIVSFVCFLIHAGSIVMVFAYLINIVKVSRSSFRCWICFFSVFAILGFWGINILNVIAPIVTFLFSLSSERWAVKAHSYLTGSTSSLSIFYYFEYLLLACLIDYNYYGLVKNRINFEFFLKIFMLLWPLYSLFGSMEIVTREKDYFIISYGVLICYLSHAWSRRYHILYTCGTVLICAYEFFRFIFNFDQGGMIPYNSWLLP